jgi:hypothetical protein
MLHVLRLSNYELNTADAHSYHSPSFMRISRGLFGHPQVGPANAHDNDNMQLCTLPQVVSKDSSAADCIKALWRFNGTPPMYNESQLQKLRRTHASR